MRLLPEKLVDTAMRTPDACVLKHRGAELTYADLANRSASVAAWLRTAGITAGARVGLLAEAGANYVIAYYGILAAGGVVVALNAAARADDIAGWLDHSGASVLILDGNHVDAPALVSRFGRRLPVIAWGNRAEVVPSERFDAVCSTGNAIGPTPGEYDLAALIYTSGTTGSPKAVVLDHGNLASNTDAIVQYLELTAADSSVCVLPFYYSFGNSVLHTHIAAGARIVIAENLVYPHKVVETMATEQVTGFAGVPSTYALLAARVNFSAYDLSQVRYLAQAGGPMSPAQVRKVRSMIPHARLFLMYGLTEATARVTHLPPEDLDRKVGSIGIPIAGVEVAIRGESGEELPAGAAGDLWVRGRNVMRGYWNDPEGSAGALVDGWLRTGDMARRDRDGYLYIEGRRSDIIKVGAHRVYPLDIEITIEELPDVLEVAVAGQDDEILGQTIVAYVVRSPGAKLSDLEIKAHCRSRLAAYKIPKLVEFCDSLPRTASGKIRRHQLDIRKTGTRR